MNEPTELTPDLLAFADALVAARLERRQIALPEGFAQRCSMAQGRAIGARNATVLASKLGGGVAGFKLGATNAAAMQRLGVERPFTGPVLSACVHAQPAAMRRDDFNVGIIEAEWCVRLGADIGGDGTRPTREALAAAIDQAFPVIEVADTRLEQWSACPPPAILADLGFGGALITGAPVPGWRDADLAAATVRLMVNGELSREGAGAAVLGHPLDALAGFIEELGARGEKLHAGQIVTTGTWTAPYMAQRGDRIEADFGALGRVTLSLD